MSAAHDHEFQPTLEVLEDRSLPSLSLNQLLLTKPHPQPVANVIQLVQAALAPVAPTISNNPPPGGFSIPNFNPAANPTHNLVSAPPSPPAAGFSIPNFSPAVNPSQNLINNPPSAPPAGFSIPNFSPFASTTHNLTQTTTAPQIDPAAITQALIDALNQPFTFGKL